MATEVSRSGGAPAEEARPPSANYHVHALARGLGLLEQMAAKAGPTALSDFSSSTGLPKSTLVRLLSVLCELEYAVRVDDQPSYRLGHKVERLASAYVSSIDLSVVTDRYLQPVARSTGQTANLGVLDGSQVLHVCISEPDRPLRFRLPPGTRDWLHCTGLGKMLLSHIDEELLPACTPPEPFPVFTDQTIATLEELSLELRRTRRRGYALDDSERNIGLRCVAVPVLVDDECLAAVSVSGPSGEFTTSSQADYVAGLRAAAADLVADPDFLAALRIVHRSLRPAGTTAELA